MNGLQQITIICIQYCAISIICAFSLIYFIFVTDRSAEHSSELLFYKLAIGFSALCAFTDIFFAMREFCMIQLGSAVNYISEILYSLGSIGGAYCWFIYSEKKQQSRISASSLSIKLFALPFAIMSLFTITTPLHKLCFSISGSQYIRGVLNVPFTIICSVFILYSGVSAGISSFRKKNHSRAVLLRMLFLYTVLIIAAQIFQIVIGPILPFRTLAATIVLMVITLRGMCETVTLDALSNINNRFSFNRTLDNKISGRDQFWLVMLDIDNFKRINDTYGHICGDDAIRYTASAIGRAVPHDHFIARYGGDEFAIVAPFTDESEIKQIEEKIRAELKKVIRENNSPFDIDITAGYAKKDDSINNTPDMIEAADKMLYERKRIKKANIK